MKKSDYMIQVTINLLFNTYLTSFKNRGKWLMKAFQRNGSSFPIILFYFIFYSIGLVPQWDENELNIQALPKIWWLQLRMEGCKRQKGPGYTFTSIENHFPAFLRHLENWVSCWVICRIYLCSKLVGCEPAQVTRLNLRVQNNQGLLPRLISHWGGHMLFKLKTTLLHQPVICMKFTHIRSDAPESHFHLLCTWC